jgi:mannose/fructose/N-acetylgalactosamine-specific phosphotransferase system component IIC
VNAPGAPVLLALTAWGTAVGLDLITFPQGLLSRPLVAGSIAGAIAGDPEMGFRVGAAMELFALDVLPVGAARYPDYGPGVVGAVVFAAGRPWGDVLGFAVFLALGLAVLGGWTLQWMRAANGRAVTRYSAGLAAGDPDTVARLHGGGILRDVVRSAGLTLASLGAALAARAVVPLGHHPGLVTAIAVGTGVAAAASGAIRTAGRGERLWWLVAGVGAGCLAVVLR